MQSNIPLIGAGCGGLNYEQTYNIVLKLLKNGYTLIDTAENYNNEKAVGEAIKDSGVDRDKITIISKYFGGKNYGDHEDITNSFNISLKNLNTTYIDIYLIHLPFGCKWQGQWEPIHEDIYTNYKNRLRCWLKLLDFKKQNLVKYIGVSNWTLDNINELKSNNFRLPDIIQNEWSPFYYDIPLYSFCCSNNIKIIGYGLFSRNTIDKIKAADLIEKTHTPSEILIKWCLKREITVIPRSTNIEHAIDNYNTVLDRWSLCDEDMNTIDNFKQIKKGMGLDSVYVKNPHIKLWSPLILTLTELNVDNIDDKIYKLKTGMISCIIVNDVISNEQASGIIKKMEAEGLLKNDFPSNNFGLNFRHNEIGITIDSRWRENSDDFFHESSKVNALFDSVFTNSLNPLDIMVDVIQKVAGVNYTVSRMKKNNILCPKGVFRIASNQNDGFPYHTDGFNYGAHLNSINDKKVTYEVMSNKYSTNSVFSVIFKIKEPDNIFEVNLYNCLVDDLENFKDDIGMYSHWMGTKYNNMRKLDHILSEKPYYAPLLKCGSIYFFSASRIHKVDRISTPKNRIVLATFMAVFNNEITIYQ
jgi:diketogulonate reductase-like aldo/keto reductase